jgi:hypothetical protein
VNVYFYLICLQAKKKQPTFSFFKFAYTANSKKGRGIVKYFSPEKDTTDGNISKALGQAIFCKTRRASHLQVLTHGLTS